MYIFYFHYNKPASLKAGKSQLSVHFRNTCYVVDGIDCKVPTYSYNRKTQPRCVIKGKCSKIEVINGMALIL